MCVGLNNASCRVSQCGWIGVGQLFCAIRSLHSLRELLHLMCRAHHGYFFSRESLIVYIFVFRLCKQYNQTHMLSIICSSWEVASTRLSSTCTCKGATTLNQYGQCGAEQQHGYWTRKAKWHRYQEQYIYILYLSPFLKALDKRGK